MPDEIATFSGQRLDPLDPDPAAVRLSDIARGLAHTCRYAGQCRHFYSVAHHSLHVRSEVAREGHDERVQAYALLHDAAEAYIADIPRPVKHRLSGYDETEQQVLEAVWTALDLRPPTDSEWETVMTADDRLFRYEAPRLADTHEWPDPPDREYDLRAEIPAVRERFRTEAQQLLARLG